MEDIENILQVLGSKDFEVPQRVHYRVQYTLKNKEKNNFSIFIKKFVMILASLMIICVGGLGVYASYGGKIAGKTVLEWLGVTFSDEYDNYKVNVDGQKLVNNGMSISLESTVCDEGAMILEFNLKLGENCSEEITEDSISVSFNNRLITDETGTYLEGLNNFSIIIDGEEFWIRPRAGQIINKISDNEFKVYQMYFLTDKELGDKRKFNITLNNVVIVLENEELQYLPLEGEFNVRVSKEMAIENSQLIKPECEEVKYKNMTKKVEQVINTPLQTIVRVSSIYENLSLNSLENTRSNDYVDNIEYKTYNQNGKRLGTYSYETKRTVTYSDGTVEEWEQGDIGTSKNFKNSKMELTEYIIVEKNDESSFIRIEASEQSGKKAFGSFKINLENEKNSTSLSNTKREDNIFEIKKIDKDAFTSDYKIVQYQDMFFKQLFNIEKQNDNIIITIVESDMNEQLFENGKGIEYNKKYVINGVNSSDVDNIFYGVEGQALDYPLLLLLQKDGTVKGVDIKYGYIRGEFFAQDILGLENVVRIEQTDVTPVNDSGYEAVVGITKDNSIYEIRCKK
ncbi:MAG: hypothetical protein HFJ25_04000 [Clostridia bacterium]|nr:hypothetical protein [Clostridia bacterium]